MKITRTLAVGLAAMTLVALAGCSSSGASGSDVVMSSTAAQAAGGDSPGQGGSNGGGQGAGGADRAAAFAKFRDCMQQHGVTMPSRGPGQGGPGQGGPGQGGPGQGGPGQGGPGQGGFFGGQLPDGVTEQQMQDAMGACQSLMPIRGRGQVTDAEKSALAAFSSCLSDHGVVLPSSNGGFPRLDRSDPKTSAAWTACAPLLPARPDAPSGGSGGPGGASDPAMAPSSS